MRKLLAFIGCLFLAGSVFAQSQLGGGGNSGGGGGLGSPSLPATANLIAENLMLDGSGNPTDASGNNNICTLAAAGAAPTWNTAASGGGLNFAGTSSQFCSYPAALNSARTMVIALNFQPGLAPYINFCCNNNNPVQVLGGNGATANSVSFELLNALSTTTWTNAEQSAYVLASQGTASSTWNSSSDCRFQGTGVIAFTMGASDQFFINGQPCMMHNASTPSAGQMTVGNYQLGGASTLITGQFFTGTVYAVAVWNIALTNAQVAQASQALQQTLSQRGIPQYLSAFGGNFNSTFKSLDHGDLAVLEDDSLFAGINVPSQGLVAQNWYTVDTAISASGTESILGRLALNDIPLYRPASNRNVFVEWAGTNDCTGNNPANAPFIAANLQASARQMSLAGFKIVLGTMISRTGEEACRDALNPLTRTSTPLYSDNVMDLGANTHLGCDGCSGNTTYFNVDGIHLTTFSSLNIIGPYYVHAINRAIANTLFYGNPNIYSGTGVSIPTPLQSVDCPSLSGASPTCTLPWTTTANSLLVLTLNCETGCAAATFNLPTSAGDTWNALQAKASYNGGAGFLAAWYACGATSAAKTVTLSFTGGAPANMYANLQEVSGVAAAACLDVQSVVNTGSSTAPSTAAVTTTATGDAVIGYGAAYVTGGTNSVAPIGVFWTAPTGFSTLNNSNADSTLFSVAGAAGNYNSSATFYFSEPWAMGTAAFKAVAGTSTYQLLDVDVYAECSPNGTNNVALTLPDGTWMVGGTITIKNAQTAGAATCVVNAPTPYQTGVQQTIDGATSVTIANKATLVLRSKYSFTGTPGSSLVPVITWEQLQNN